MKMLSFGCNSLREGITTAIVFSVTGVLLILTALFIIPAISYLPHIVMISGALLLLFVPVIITATIIKNRKA
ncbi:MAG: hypothetical protein U9Q75_08885 [Pseudomonadota bacterium]|nr:hypothetical protein [Pseudomonadota bacterium]